MGAIAPIDFENVLIAPINFRRKQWFKSNLHRWIKIPDDLLGNLHPLIEIPNQES